MKAKKKKGSQIQQQKKRLNSRCECRQNPADLADIRRSDTGALRLAEGHVQGELYGEPGHCPRGQRLDFGHSLDQSGFSAVRLERHLKSQGGKLAEDV